MLSEKGLGLLKSLLTYDPKSRASCESAMRAEYFREDPRPIDPSMFPTWPAKSEQEPGDKGFFYFFYNFKSREEYQQFLAKEYFKGTVTP